MERRFACTVCGKCCQGWLPLTLEDAVRHAHRFPLAVLWSTVRQGAKAFALTERLGLPLSKKVALRITPLSYLPPQQACPALADDGKCAIHHEKPLRCRVMPFSADREEKDQADLLIPRKDWLCDISAVAPAVYREGKILDSRDFDAERRAFESQAPIVKAYGDFLLKSSPAFKAEMEKLALRPGGGQMILKISPLLRKAGFVDLADFARRQAPVLRRFQALASDQDYARNYADWAVEMEGLQRNEGDGA
ncbi:MAG: YkgJ family cysteine cluster protein [Alphaproteobacteria bacterium]|nr:YkgJ family cysteine cluster protein [Alphaproteobacteria bacterium]